MKIDKEKCRDTFHPWRIYEPSGVTIVGKEQLEREGYQSSYLIYYNYIMDKGWKREDRRWISPCGSYRHVNIYDAYRCQKMKEIIEE